MVGAVRVLRRLGLTPRGRVQLQSVVEEECTGNGALACVLAGHTRRRRDPHRADAHRDLERAGRRPVVPRSACSARRRTPALTDAVGADAIEAVLRGDRGAAGPGGESNRPRTTQFSQFSPGRGEPAARRTKWSWSSSRESRPLTNSCSRSSSSTSVSSSASSARLERHEDEALGGDDGGLIVAKSESKCSRSSGSASASPASAASALLSAAWISFLATRCARESASYA